jgi:hypothetical protein
VVKSISVQIKPSRASYDYGETIELELIIKNESKERLFIVSPERFHETNPPYIWKSGARRISILLGEDRVPPGLFYYDFNPPAYLSLAPGRARKIGLSIGMPPTAGRIEDDNYYWIEAPVSGKVRIEVKVGFLRKRFHPKTLAPWEEFVDQQELSNTAYATVKIAK